MFLLIPLFLYLSLLLPSNAQAASFSLEPRSTACIRAYDGGRQSNGQQVIRFYSTCPQDMYINVCVKDEMGDVKLYKSSTYIKTNGSYTVFTYPNSYPRAVQWTSATFNPEIPPLCNKEKTKPKTYNAW